VFSDYCLVNSEPHRCICNPAELLYYFSVDYYSDNFTVPSAQCSVPSEQ
jgi:hypothetical protein